MGIAEPSRVSVYTAVRDHVLSIQSGAPVRVDPHDLAASLGLPSVTVREALRHLVEQGLLELEASHQYRTPELDVRSARELFHLRSVVESEAAALAALADLDLAVLRELDAAAGAGDVDAGRGRGARSGPARSFHESLAQATGNLRLMQTLREVLDELGPYERGALRHASCEAVGRLRHGHVAVVTAVKRGDSEQARAEARAHVAAAQILVLDFLVAQGRDADVLAFPRSVLEEQ